MMAPADSWSMLSLIILLDCLIAIIRLLRNRKLNRIMLCCRNINLLF
jgi:hypothetical protein